MSCNTSSSNCIARYSHQYRGGTFRAWLSQVARHRSLDELRRRRLILFSDIEPFPNEGEYACLTTLPDLDLQPEEQVELHELRELLLDAIETLPVRYRAVVLLRYTTQLSFREIGQALSIPETTAKTYFYRARKPLRTLLEEAGKRRKRAPAWEAGACGSADAKRAR